MLEKVFVLQEVIGLEKVIGLRMVLGEKRQVEMDGDARIKGERVVCEATGCALNATAVVVLKAPTRTCAGVIFVNRENLGVEEESKSLETVQSLAFPVKISPS